MHKSVEASLCYILQFFIHIFHIQADDSISKTHDTEQIFKGLKLKRKEKLINSSILNTPTLLFYFLHIHHSTNAIINTVIYLAVTWC